jgi:2-beta-glucuronyltransferase
LNAVSVGSMLFDPEFFWMACDLFPEINFHVIGSGAKKGRLPAAVIDHGEMPFHQTLPFIKHATFGIAPYRASNPPYYLADTSLKLTQFAFFGLPAVCPKFAAGEHPLRFAYLNEGGAPQKDTVKDAIERACAAPHSAIHTAPSWSEIVEQLLC